MDGIRSSTGRAFSHRPRGWAPVLVSLVALLVPATASGVTEFAVPTPVEPAGRDHRRAGRSTVVHRGERPQDRPHHHGWSDHRIPDSEPSERPHEITAGPDGALWFTEFGANPPKIGRMTTAGAFTEFDSRWAAAPTGSPRDPTAPCGSPRTEPPRSAASRPEGDHHRVPAAGGFRPGDITPGPDGRLWFTESEANKIGAITMPATSPSTTFRRDRTLWNRRFRRPRCGSPSTGMDQIGRIPTVGPPGHPFRPDRCRALRDRIRSGRVAVVHRDGGRQDRPDDDQRLDHRVRHPDSRQRARGDRRRARRSDVVHRVRRQQHRADRGGGATFSPLPRPPYAGVDRRAKPKSKSMDRSAVSRRCAAWP